METWKVACVGRLKMCYATEKEKFAIHVKSIFSHDNLQQKRRSARKEVLNTPSRTHTPVSYTHLRAHET